MAFDGENADGKKKGKGKDARGSHSSDSEAGEDGASHKKGGKGSESDASKQGMRDDKEGASGKGAKGGNDSEQGDFKLPPGALSGLSGGLIGALAKSYLAKAGKKNGEDDGDSDAKEGDKKGKSAQERGEDGDKLKGMGESGDSEAKGQKKDGKNGLMGTGISEGESGKDGDGKRKGSKKGQGGSDDDTSKDGESASKQGKNKKDGDELKSSDVSETGDGKKHGKRRSKDGKDSDDDQSGGKGKSKGEDGESEADDKKHRRRKNGKSDDEDKSKGKKDGEESEESSAKKGKKDGESNESEADKKGKRRRHRSKSEKGDASDDEKKKKDGAVAAGAGQLRTSDGVGAENTESGVNGAKLSQATTDQGYQSIMTSLRRDNETMTDVTAQNDPQRPVIRIPLVLQKNSQFNIDGSPFITERSSGSGSNSARTPKPTFERFAPPPPQRPRPNTAMAPDNGKEQNTRLGRRAQSVVFTNLDSYMPTRDSALVPNGNRDKKLDGSQGRLPPLQNNSSSRLSSSRRQIPSRLERPAPLHLKIGQGTDSSQGPPMSGYASSRRARSVMGQGYFSARYPMSSRHADFTQEAMAGLERYRMESARYHFQGLVLPTSVLRVRFLGSPSVNNEDDVSLQSQYIPQECLLNAQAQALEKEQAPEVSFSKLMSMVHIDDMIKTQAATNSVDNSARVSSRRATARGISARGKSPPHNQDIRFL